MANKTKRVINSGSQASAETPLYDLGDGQHAEAVTLVADVRAGRLKSRKVAMTGAVVELDISEATIGYLVQGVSLYPSADVRFAIDEDPAAESAVAFVVGGIAKANEWLHLTLVPGVATFRLLGANGVNVETMVR